MPTIVALAPVAGYDTGRAAYYPVRLGPLRFTCLVGDVPEALGDKLEAVGAALVPGDRSPRPAQIVLPVVGSTAEVDPRGQGLVLRRQVRALMENTAWKQHGLYFEAGWDPETAAWLMVGGGQLTDEQRGFAFGDWRLTLDDAYMVGRPATHRRGRRVTVADRADGVTAADTRGNVYSTDLAAYPGTVSAAIPGDIDAATGYRGRPPAQVAGPTVDGRLLWSAVPAVDGEVLTWRPNTAILPEPREREAVVDDTGGVVAWAMPGVPGTTSPVGDRQPDLAYGWERLTGDLADYTTPVAIENGWTRCVWLGAQDGGGLRIERWDTSVDRYVPVTRVLHRKGTAEARIVELTGERVVVSWTVAGTDMRAILQRGWPGPRIEVYAPYAAAASLAMAADTGLGALSAVVPFVARFAVAGGAAKVAGVQYALAFTNGPGELAEASGTWSVPASGGGPGPATLVLQIDAHDGDGVELRTLARYDVRAIPVLAA